MQTIHELSERIDAALAGMEAHRRQFQEMETRKYEEWKQRLEQLNAVFDGVRDLLKPHLDMVISRFGDKVTATPTLAQSTRDVVLDFQSPVARIRLRFQATSDRDIRKLILNYDLEIIPILMQFDSHAELEMPLDAIDHEAIVRWANDRILSFVRTYVAIHENQYYLHDQMVTDPVTGTTFPKLAAGATLERDGRTYYFVSETTRREFEGHAAGAATERPAAAMGP